MFCFLVFVRIDCSSESVLIDGKLKVVYRNSLVVCFFTTHYSEGLQLFDNPQVHCL